MKSVRTSFPLVSFALFTGVSSATEHVSGDSGASFAASCAAICEQRRAGPSSAQHVWEHLVHKWLSLDGISPSELNDMGHAMDANVTCGTSCLSCATG